MSEVPVKRSRPRRFELILPSRMYESIDDAERLGIPETPSDLAVELADSLAKHRVEVDSSAFIPEGAKADALVKDVLARALKR